MLNREKYVIKMSINNFIIFDDRRAERYALETEKRGNPRIIGFHLIVVSTNSH